MAKNKLVLEKDEKKSIIIGCVVSAVVILAAVLAFVAIRKNGNKNNTEQVVVDSYTETVSSDGNVIVTNQEELDRALAKILGVDVTEDESGEESAQTEEEENTETEESADSTVSVDGSETTDGEVTATTVLPDTITGITFQTEEEQSIEIGEGDYSAVDFTIDAPYTEVTNNGNFQNIYILQIASSTWTENASGNSIFVSAPSAHIIVSEDGYLSQIQNSSYGSTLALEVFGTVDNVFLQADDSISSIFISGTMGQIYVNNPTNLTLSGTSTSNIPVSIESTATGSTVKTTIPVAIDSNAQSDIEIQAGAEGSTVAAYLDYVETSITNSTEESITATDSDGTEVEIKAGETETLGDATNSTDTSSSSSSSSSDTSSSSSTSSSSILGSTTSSDTSSGSSSSSGSGSSTSSGSSTTSSSGSGTSSSSGSTVSNVSTKGTTSSGTSSSGTSSTGSTSGTSSSSSTGSSSSSGTSSGTSSSTTSSQISALQTENSNLSSKVSTLQTENSTLSSKISSLESTIAEYVSQITSLTTKITETNTKLEEIEKEQAEAEAEAEKEDSGTKISEAIPDNIKEATTEIVQDSTLTDIEATRYLTDEAENYSNCQPGEYIKVTNKGTENKIYLVKLLFYYFDADGNWINISTIDSKYIKPEESYIFTRNNPGVSAASSLKIELTATTSDELTANPTDLITKFTYDTTTLGSDNTLKLNITPNTGTSVTGQTVQVLYLKKNTDSEENPTYTALDLLEYRIVKAEEEGVTLDEDGATLCSTIQSASGTDITVKQLTDSEGVITINLTGSPPEGYTDIQARITGLRADATDANATEGGEGD